jgi:hypothetical protein
MPLARIEAALAAAPASIFRATARPEISRSSAPESVIHTWPYWEVHAAEPTARPSPVYSGAPRGCFNRQVNGMHPEVRRYRWTGRRGAPSVSLYDLRGLWEVGPSSGPARYAAEGQKQGLCAGQGNAQGNGEDDAKVRGSGDHVPLRPGPQGATNL